MVSLLLGKKASVPIRILRTAVCIVSLLIVFIVISLHKLQSGLPFDPSPVLISGEGAFYPQGPPEAVALQSASGDAISGWFFGKPKAKGTLLFLRSGAANMSYDLEPVRFFSGLGLNVFIIDYRGFGESEGLASEKGTYADAATAWDYLITERGIEPSDIVLYGRSLGGAVALHLARDVRPAGVIVESGYRSVARSLSGGWQRYFGGLWPVYPSVRFIRDIDSPVLIVHSRADKVVAFEEGHALYQAANDPKTFLEVKGLHGDAIFASQKEYRDAVFTFLEPLLD